MSVSLFKNVSGQQFFIELLTSAGVPVVGSPSGYVTKDSGAQAAISGTITHVGNGQYRVALTQADTNADSLGFLFTLATAVQVSVSVRTTDAASAASALAGTWTYDPTLMQSTTAGTYAGSTVGMRNQIRWVIQDVQASRPLMVDAEVDWAQTIESNAYMSAAMCCEILVARAGNVKSKKVGSLALEYDVEFYRGLAATLRSRGLTGQLPYCGGISISDKMAQQDNGDWVPPRFFRGMFDNPRAEQPSANVEQTPNYPGPSY